MRMYEIMEKNVIWNEHTGGMFSKSCNIGKEDRREKTEVTWIYEEAGYILRRMAYNANISGKRQRGRQNMYQICGKLDAKYTWSSNGVRAEKLTDRADKIKIYYKENEKMEMKNLREAYFEIKIKGSYREIAIAIESEAGDSLT